MKCLRCEHDNPQGARFCEECAAPLARTCANCGTALSATAKLCHACAHPVAVGAATPSRSPDSYTPKHLAEKILTSKAALEGERKLVTVLFADLKGSMELLADRDPEEARKILDPVLELMMEAVHRYEGTVNQVMGDGIMALFGAPLAHEDHAVRACYAALRMQESVKRHAGEMRRATGVPLAIRVGLNSGEVVVRSIGSDLHMDYTAVGQTTHLAARMEQAALPGSVVLTPDTLRLAEGYIEVKPLGAMPVKGMVEPVEVYELTGGGPARTRFQAAAARGLTRFVGRQSELEQLHQALMRARVGHGQIVAVVGEPGVGKSRLYWEFSHSARADDWLVLESGSVSFGRATNYSPIIELLRVYFPIESADDLRMIREKVTGKLLLLDRQLEPCITPVLWLLDCPIEDEEWARLDPPQRRHRVLEAIKRLLLRESQVQPLMVLFDDLHWIDAETQALLDSFVENLPTARVLLLVNYRPEYRHGWGGKTYYRQIQIDPLPIEPAEALLDALLGSDAALASLKRLLIQRTEGNPFFIEECVRSLVDTGVLSGEPGMYRLTRIVQDLQIPATVLATVAARIDRLALEHKRLLQAAAVIGTDVPFELLQSVAEEQEDQLFEGLARLQATEFLYESRLFPDLEYTFRHALTHEVAYGGLLVDRRRVLHARIVEALEQRHPERLAEHVERLAHHAVKGEVWDKAATYLRQAGVKSFSRGANREAVVWFGSTADALARLPETPDTVAAAIDVQCEMRNALTALGEHERVFEHLRKAEALAEASNDPRRLARVWSLVSQSHMIAGAHDDALEAGLRALHLAEASDDLDAEVMANAALGVAFYHRGEFHRCMLVSGRSIALLDAEQVTRRFELPIFPAVSGRCFLACSLAHTGDFVQALALGNEAVGIAERLGHTYSVLHADFQLGCILNVKGDFQAAAHRLEHGMSIKAADTRLSFPYLAGFLGTAYANSGRLEEGVSLLERAVETADTINVSAGLSYIAADLGEAYFLAGRVEDATCAAQRALELSRRHKEQGWAARASRLCGTITADPRSGRGGAAEPHYQNAMRLAGELGMRPLVAHCHLGLGKLYRRTGKHEQAQGHLATATTMYREMGMTYWLEKTEAEMTKPGG